MVFGNEVTGGTPVPLCLVWRDFMGLALGSEARLGRHVKG